MDIELKSIPNNLPGIFVAIEGIDGAGKTSLVQEVAALLDCEKSNIVICGGGYFETTKEVLRHVREKETASSYTMGLVYALDYFMQMEFLIMPALYEGKVVLSDRYIFSSFAYNLAYGLDIDWNKTIYRNSLKPDLVFFLDTPPSLALERRRDSDPIAWGFDKKFEDFQLDVRKFFLDFSKYFLILQPAPLHFLAQRVLSEINEIRRNGRGHIL